MVHKLKTLPKYFFLVWTGEKPFEVRKDDRNYRIGDELLLQEFYNGEYTGNECKRKITYILGRNEDEKMFIADGYVILGIK